MNMRCCYPHEHPLLLLSVRMYVCVHHACSRTSSTPCCSVQVEVLLAAVGGIMAFLAISELLPLALEHAGRTAAVTSLFAGMALMSANMWLLDVWVGGGPGHNHAGVQAH